MRPKMASFRIFRPFGWRSRVRHISRDGSMLRHQRLQWPKMSADPVLAALADCNPNQPLEPGDRRFVDLDDIRGFALRNYLLKRLRACDTTE